MAVDAAARSLDTEATASGGGDTEPAGAVDVSLLTGRFRDRDLERSYLAHSFGGVQERLRVVTYPGAAFFLAGAAVDALISTSDAVLLRLVALRLVVAGVVATFGWAVGRLDRRPSWLDTATTGVVAFVAGATCLLIASSPGELLLHALTVLVLLVVFYLFVPMPVLHGLGVGVAFSCGFCGVAVRQNPAPSMLSLIVLYLVLVNVLGGLAVRRRHATRRREYLVLQAERSVSAALRREVEARRQAEAKLADSEARFRDLVELSPDGVVVHVNGVVKYANQACLRLVGVDSLDDAVGRSIFSFIHPDHQERIRGRMARLVTTDPTMPPIEIVVVTRSGDELMCEVVSGATVFDGQSAVQSVIRDAADRHRLQEELERQATTDPLTGIANRRRFFDVLEAEFSRARRHGRPLGLLMMDIDNFKRVNDEHGHAVGDDVLVRLVGAARELLRSEDLFARLGGEEFAAVLPEIDLQGAHAVAERIRAGLAETEVEAPEGVVRCTVSLGVIQARPAHESPDHALKRADDALYEAKRAGRDRVIVAS